VVPGEFLSDQPIKEGDMVKRLIVTAALLLAALCAGANAEAETTNADTTMVGIYRNTLETLAQRSEVLRLTGHGCSRAGDRGRLVLAVGKRTEECVYRSPVLGRNLEIAAAEQLSEETPRAVARKAFLGLVLRAGGGTRFELRVFPAQKKIQLLKFSAEGGTEYLAIEKRVVAVKEIGETNVLRLRAEGDGSRTKLIAHLGSAVVGEAIDEGPRIEGEYSAVTVGAPRNGHGVRAEFGGIVVRVPVRF
jgi:hypothetical protein